MIDISSQSKDSPVVFVGKSTEGRKPRNFAISPDGTFLLVANQKSNNIVTFKIDPASGQLLKTKHNIEAPMPVCVKFVHLKW